MDRAKTATDMTPRLLFEWVWIERKKAPTHDSDNFRGFEFLVDGHQTQKKTTG